MNAGKVAIINNRTIFQNFVVAKVLETDARSLVPLLSAGAMPTLCDLEKNRTSFLVEKSISLCLTKALENLTHT